MMPDTARVARHFSPPNPAPTMWSYFTFSRGARLITGPIERAPAPARERAKEAA